MIRLAPDAQVLSRHQHATHFRNDDGKRVAIFGRDLNYLDAGQWATVSMDLEDKQTSAISSRLPHHTVEVTLTGVKVADKKGQGVRWLTASPPLVAGHSASYRKDGLSWRYSVRRNGAKLEAVVAAPRGPQTYTFGYQMIGLPDWVIGANGELVSGGWRVPAPHVVDAKGVVHLCGPWQLLSGSRVGFGFDDTGIPTPYTIDPSTTYEPGATGDDGYVTSTPSASYPPASGSPATGTASAQIEKSLNTGNYIIAVGLVRFDTSSLDNSVQITAADLKLYFSTVLNSDGRSMTAEWYYTWPIVAGSYTSTVGTDAHSGTAMSSLSVGPQYTFALDNYRSGVKTTDYTGLRLHLSGAAPSGDNQLYFYTYDNGSSEPQLVVSYVGGGMYMVV